MFTFIGLLWIGLERAVGLHDEYIGFHSTYTNLFAFIAILLYVLALLDKRNHYYKGYISWKNAFFSGLVLSAIIAILSPLSQLISHKIVTPHYFENAINHAVSRKIMSQQEAESYFSLGNYILQTTFFAFIVGCITAALISIFIRKSPQAI
ncbi:DUF4199 domain-containing protein [Echinicola jeungdonensis]|uniref:DUF4199 domain-containing protein n=1 Tax=Echinicola jeungdonensis TaxID=709343 RepID=UPI0025B397DF|nr:DUF4199 domain-containing protein [Echinicola jeungdonensis]MDN3670328.1 DUF4199 domain-containing protein [Echinicola jeungdonensis]